MTPLISWILSNGIRARFDELKKTSNETQKRFHRLVSFDRLEIKFAQQMKVKQVETKGKKNQNLQAHIIELMRNSDEQRQEIFEHHQVIQTIKDRFDRMEQVVNDFPSANGTPTPMMKESAMVSPTTPATSLRAVGDEILPIPTSPTLIRLNPNPSQQTHSNMRKKFETHFSNQTHNLPPIQGHSHYIWTNRFKYLQSEFDCAIKTQCYEPHYLGVYSVKCNQDRFLIKNIAEFGSNFRIGIEVGLKHEIVLAMSCLCKGNPDAILVCNGFKDSENISLALLRRKLGLNIVIVIEQEEVLDLVINFSMKMNVRRVIGLQAELRAKHSGHEEVEELMKRKNITEAEKAIHRKRGLDVPGKHIEGTTIQKLEKNTEKKGEADRPKRIPGTVGQECYNLNSHLEQGKCEDGEIWTFTIRAIDSSHPQRTISVSYDGFAEDVRVRDELLVDGGMVRFEVIEKIGLDAKCLCTNPRLLLPRANLTFWRYGSLVRERNAMLPTIASKDWLDIDFGIAEALWMIARGNVANNDRITETKRLLSLAKIVQKEVEELQYNFMMTLMEIAAAAESSVDLRRAVFKTNSSAAKAVIDQMLWIIKEVYSPILKIPATQFIWSLLGTFSTREKRMIEPLVEKLSSSNQEVVITAVIALQKFVCCEKSLYAEHLRNIIKVGAVPSLRKLLRNDEQQMQLQCLALLCYLSVIAGCDPKYVNHPLSQSGHQEVNSLLYLTERMGFGIFTNGLKVPRRLFLYTLLMANLQNHYGLLGSCSLFDMPLTDLDSITLGNQCFNVDVDDCCGCVKYVASSRKADNKWLCTCGGSAGDYTTFAALEIEDVFKTGVSLYGVADLKMLKGERYPNAYLEDKVSSKGNGIDKIHRVDVPWVLVNNRGRYKKTELKVKSD